MQLLVTKQGYSIPVIASIGNHDGGGYGLYTLYFTLVELQLTIESSFSWKGLSEIQLSRRGAVSASILPTGSEPAERASVSEEVVLLSYVLLPSLSHSLFLWLHPFLPLSL
jgi:hypothetical protein